MTASLIVLSGLVGFLLGMEVEAFLLRNERRQLEQLDRELGNEGESL